MTDFKMYIGGEWKEAVAGEYFDGVNPYTGAAWARIPRGRAEDVDAAVEAAHKAFSSGPWREISATNRGHLLRKLADLMEANAEHLADLEVADNGKLKAEMLVQMKYLPQWFYYFAGLVDKVQGEVTPIDKPGMFHYTTYEPLGVVGVIAPWNSPLLLASWKIAPALAAGNTIVVKPSEFSSTSTLYFAQLCEEAGIPAGVFNVITGYGPEVGEPLVKHPLVSRISFTGSENGGKRVYENAASSFKRVSLELGGKSANIVFEDADLDSAVKGAVSGIFAATGQSCMAGSRLLLQSSIHDEFIARLLKFMENAKLGDPTDPETNVGPVSNKPQFDKTLRYIEIAKNEGARCVLGGGRSTRPGSDNGLFVEPTVFIDVRPGMRIAQEEVFGPVLAVIKFDDEEDAIRIANGTNYGLAAGFWTRDLERVMILPKRLAAGTVWVNAYRVVSYMAPFGGVKASGLGRESGIDAIYDYLESKSVFINPNPAEKAKTADPFVLG